MYKYDETSFNLDIFLDDVKKKYSVDILHERLNDIITYQNWYDKSMSLGTNYFTNYEILKYYQLQDYEKITYETVFEEFRNMYDWFTDDENYNILVNKLLNVFLGYDQYEEVVNFKNWKKNINSKKCNMVENSEPISTEKKITKKVAKKNIVESPKIVKVNDIQSLKDNLLSCIDNNNSTIDEAINILRKIYDAKKVEDNTDQINIIKKTIEKYLYDDRDLQYIKINLLKDIQQEIIKYLKYQYMASIKNTTTENNKTYELESFTNDYVINLNKKCIKCSQNKLKHNFIINKLKKDGYENICKNCNK